MELPNSLQLHKFLHGSFEYKRILYLFYAFTSIITNTLTYENRESKACGFLIYSIRINLMSAYSVVSYAFLRRDHYLCKHFCKKAFKRIQDRGFQNRGLAAR